MRDKRLGRWPRRFFFFGGWSVSVGISTLPDHSRSERRRAIHGRNHDIICRCVSSTICRYASPSTSPSKASRVSFLSARPVVLDCTCVRPSRDDNAVYEYWKLTNPRGAGVSTSSTASWLEAGDNRRTGVMDRLLILPLRLSLMLFRWDGQPNATTGSSEQQSTPRPALCTSRFVY